MISVRGVVRGVGKQPLLIAVIAVFIFGAAAAAQSWSTPYKPSLVFVPKTPATTNILGEHSFSADRQNGQNPTDGQNQGNTSQNTNNQPPYSPGPPKTDPIPTPTPLPDPLPPVIIKPPLPTPTPQPLPCNSCMPRAGYMCPMTEAQPSYVVYPCTPCGGGVKTEMVCRLPEAQ